MADQERGVMTEIERLKKLLLQPAPLWIDGIDFLAFNFGDESQRHSEAGRNSLITSASGSAVIDRHTGKWRFTAPHMRLTNVSHVPECEKAKISLTFLEVKKLIEGQ